MKTKVTILGAGNVGCAIAGFLASKGLQVCLYSDPFHAKRWEGIRKRGCLTLQGEMVGDYVLTLTADLREAVENSSILFVTLPAFARERVLTRLAPYIKDDVILFFAPGSFSTFTALRHLGASKDRVIFAEVNSVPFPCRSVVDGVATILQPKRTLDIGIYPKKHQAKTLFVLNELFNGILQLQEHMVAIGLNNPNGVVHPCTALLNLGRIEDTQGDFFFYRQGMTDSVAKLSEAIDRDRIEIGKRLGITIKPLLQIAHEFYGTQFTSMREFALHSKLHNSVKACPVNIHDRYFTEDIPYVLVPWFSLGEALGVHSPILRSVIEIGSYIHNIDFQEKGTNLKAMGLDHLDIHGIQKKLMGEL